MTEQIKMDFDTLRKYEHCPMCERRIFVALFDGHACCANCRGVTATGMPIPKYTKDSQE
jgi:hypothetical protein